MRIDYDKFGHCVKCHKHLQIEKVIDGKLQIVFVPEKTEEELLLSDGSRMRVTICKSCKEGLTDEGLEVVMNSVVKGWEKEVEGLNHWSKDKKADYITNYSKKEAVCKATNMPVDVLEKKLAKFKKEK